MVGWLVKGVYCLFMPNGTCIYNVQIVCLNLSQHIIHKIFFFFCKLTGQNSMVNIQWSTFKIYKLFFLLLFFLSFNSRQRRQNLISRQHALEINPKRRPAEYYNSEYEVDSTKSCVSKAERIRVSLFFNHKRWKKMLSKRNKKSNYFGSSLIV